MAMSDGHRDRLRQNRVNLVQYMKVTDLFLVKFADGNVLTSDMMEEIKSIPTRQGKAGRLLDMLVRRGGRAFNRLIEALKLTSQEALIEGLCPRSTNIQNDQSIQDILHLIDNAPTELAVIPMTEVEKQNRDDFVSAHKIYAAPSSGDHGQAVIISYGPSTICTEPDTEILTKLFSLLHYETKQYSCKQQVDVIEQLKKMQEKLDTEDYESLVVFILGSRKDERLEAGKITSIFDADQCPNLKGKAKIFFISNEESKAGQERGTNPVQVSLDEPDGKRQAFPPASVKADQLVVYFNASSAYGPAGGRFGGSMFIKALTHSFAKHACGSSITDLLQLVTNIGSELRKRSEDSSYGMNLFQESRLQFDFYFSP